MCEHAWPGPHTVETAGGPIGGRRVDKRGRSMQWGVLTRPRKGTDHQYTAQRGWSSPHDAQGRHPDTAGHVWGCIYLARPDSHTHRWRRNVDRGGAGDGWWARGLRETKDSMQGLPHPKRTKGHGTVSFETVNQHVLRTSPPGQGNGGGAAGPRVAGPSWRVWRCGHSLHPKCDSSAHARLTGLLRGWWGRDSIMAADVSRRDTGNRRSSYIVLRGLGVLAVLGHPPAPRAPSCAGQARLPGASLRLFNKD